MKQRTEQIKGWGDVYKINWEWPIYGQNQLGQPSSWVSYKQKVIKEWLNSVLYWNVRGIYAANKHDRAWKTTILLEFQEKLQRKNNILMNLRGTHSRIGSHGATKHWTWVSLHRWVALQIFPAFCENTIHKWHRRNLRRVLINSRGLCEVFLSVELVPIFMPPTLIILQILDIHLPSVLVAQLVERSPG